MVLRKIRGRVRSARSTLNFLLLQRRGGLSPPSHPEFDPETLARFQIELARASSYLEYGSGGSTLLVDRVGIPAVSVESDRFYAEKVRSVLKPDTLVQLAVPPMGLTKQWGMPIFEASRKGAGYVNAPFEILKGAFPDFVLVDGRYRAACILEVARRAISTDSSATVILDDYIDRPHYHTVERLLGAPQLTGRSAVFRVGRQAVSTDDVSAHISDPR